jgi:putative FmdB family regulatory protein
MPIYEYVCLDCRTRFETLRPMRDADQPIACINCAGEHTARCLTVFYARSSQGSLVGSSSGCASCSSSSCATCGRN